MPVPTPVPVAIPAVLKEMPGLPLLQVPPVTVDDKVVELPTHTVDAPEIVPAEPGNTVSTAGVVAVPQVAEDAV